MSTASWTQLVAAMAAGFALAAAIDGCFGWAMLFLLIVIAGVT